jgi:Tfp pilus assembly protein PilF
LSLIADSLKKANKANLVREAFPHARNRNPLALKKTPSGPGIATITKITFLVALPGIVLIYLVQAGVFSGKQILTNDRTLAKVSEPKQKIFESASASLHTELQNRNLVTSPAIAEKNPITTKPAKPTVNTTSPQSASPVIVQSPSSQPKKIVAEKVTAKAVIAQERIAPPEIVPPSQAVLAKPVVVAAEKIFVPVALTKPVMMAEVTPVQPVVPVPGKEIDEEKSPAKLVEENPLVKMPAVTKLKEIIAASAPTSPVKMVQGVEPSTVSAVEKKQPTELQSPGETQKADNPVIEEKHVEAKVDMAKAKALQGSQPIENKPLATDDLALLVTPRQPVQDGEVFKTSGYYFNRAVFFQQAKDWEQALDNYQMAAKLDQNNADIYNNMGVVNKEMRRFDQAIEELLRAVYLNPDYDKAYNNLGVVYYLKNQFDGAIRNYRKAIDLDQKNLEAFNNLAIVHKKKNEMEQAKSVLNQALAMNAKHPGTNYNLAVLHEELNEVTQAIYYYQRFVRFGRKSYPDLVFTVQDHLATLTR